MANRIFVSHWKRVKPVLDKIKREVGSRKVVHVAVKDQGRCIETYPCQHYNTVLVLQMEDESCLEFRDLSSVQIGVIQRHFDPEADGHFTGYAEGYKEWDAKQ